MKYLLPARAFSLLLNACNKKESGSKNSPTPNVEFVLPVQKKITSWDYYIGRLEAVESVEVRTRVNGILKEIHFKEGSQCEA